MERWNTLVILRPTRAAMLTEGPTTDEVRIIGEHFQYYRRLVDAGLALLVGRTQENNADTIGLAILAADDEPHALRLANDDPAVEYGVMVADVRPYSIALFHSISP